MKIAAIDTSTKTLCVGVSDGEKAYEYNVDYATRLSRCLVPALGRVFEAAGVTAADFDYFACGTGPGSFTGIRIGMACIKGLAWASSAPVVGVSSLDVVALNARREEGLIASVIDARRGFVYAALYRVRKDRLFRLSAYLLVTPQDLLSRINRHLGKKKASSVVFCGDGIPVMRPHAAGSAQARFLDADYWKPQGRHVLELAKERIAAKEVCDALAINPLYLYPKECQIRK